MKTFFLRALPLSLLVLWMGAASLWLTFQVGEFIGTLGLRVSDMNPSRVIQFYYGVALVEESIKLMCGTVLYSVLRFAGLTFRQSALLAALGFSLGENAMYAYNQWQNVWIFFRRMLFATPLHLACTMLIVNALGKRTPVAMLTAFVIGVTLHMSWNILSTFDYKLIVMLMWAACLGIVQVFCQDIDMEVKPIF